MLKTVRSRHQIDTSWLKLTWEIANPWSQSSTGNPALRAMINIQINWSIWKTWNTGQFLRQIGIYCYDTDIIIALIWWIGTVNNKILSKIFHRDLSEKSDRSKFRKWMTKQFLRVDTEFIWFVGTSNLVIEMSDDSKLIDATMSCCQDSMLRNSSSSTLTFLELEKYFSCISRRLTRRDIFGILSWTNLS